MPVLIIILVSSLGESRIGGGGKFDAFLNVLCVLGVIRGWVGGFGVKYPQEIAGINTAKYYTEPWKFNYLYLAIIHSNCVRFFKQNCLSSHKCPEKPGRTQVVVGSMNMKYDIILSDTARNRTHYLFRPKCGLIH